MDILNTDERTLRIFLRDLINQNTEHSVNTLDFAYNFSYVSQPSLHYNETQLGEFGDKTNAPRKFYFGTFQHKIFNGSNAEIELSLGANEFYKWVPQITGKNHMFINHLDNVFFSHAMIQNEYDSEEAERGIPNGDLIEATGFIFTGIEITIR